MDTQNISNAAFRCLASGYTGPRLHTQYQKPSTMYYVHYLEVVGFHGHVSMQSAISTNFSRMEKSCLPFAREALKAKIEILPTNLLHSHRSKGLSIEELIDLG